VCVFSLSEDAISDHEMHTTEVSYQKSKKKRRSKDPQHVDLTPPDKHLKTAERKAKKYSRVPDRVSRKFALHFILRTLLFEADDAMHELICCTALARIVYGDGHWRVAKAHADLAEGYSDIRGEDFSSCAS
jgi:hypothetical protein